MCEKKEEEEDFSIMVTDDALARRIAEELFERARDLLEFKREKYVKLFMKAVKDKKINPYDVLEVGLSFTYMGNDVFQIIGRIVRSKGRGGSGADESGG